MAAIDTSLATRDLEADAPRRIAHLRATLSAQVERRATRKGMHGSLHHEDRWPASAAPQSAQVDRTTEAGNDRNAFWRPRWARGQGTSGEVGVDGMSMRWSMSSVRIRWHLAAISGGNCHEPERCSWAPQVAGGATMTAALQAHGRRRSRLGAAGEAAAVVGPLCSAAVRGGPTSVWCPVRC